jgi:hypothetical protein
MNFILFKKLIIPGAKYVSSRIIAFVIDAANFNSFSKDAGFRLRRLGFGFR